MKISKNSRYVFEIAMANIQAANEILTAIESGAVTSWKEPVANAGALPTSGNSDGDGRIALDTHTFFIWDGASWVPQGGGGAGIPSGGTTGQVLTKNSNSNYDVVWADVATGSPNNLPYFDSNGNLADWPNLTRNTISGGLDISLTQQPNNGGGNTVHNWAHFFEPLQNSPNENWNIFNVPVYLDNNNSGFDQGSISNTVQLWNAAIIHQGIGNVGGLTFHNEGFQIGNGTDPITVKTLNVFNGYGNINANVTLDGGVLGYGMGINVNAAAAITGNFYINAFYDYNNIQTPITSYASANFSPNITEIQNNSGMTVVSLSPQIGTLTGNASANGVNFSPTITTMGANAGVTGSIFNPNIGSAVAGYVHGLDIYGIIPTLNGNFSGVNIGPTISAGTGDFYGVNLTPSGGAPLTNVIGLNVDLTNLSSPQQKKGLTINDGALQVISNYDTSVLPASPGFASMNQLTGLFQVAAGHPMTSTLVFANQLSVNALFYDDMGPDGFGGFGGFSNLGLATQISVQSGKTVDTINSVVAAFSVPAIAGDGGTVTNATSYLAGGVFPGGGNLTVANLFGLKVPSGFSTLATNAWGLYIDDASTENYISKSLVIGGSTKKVTNSDVGFEIASAKALLLPRVTTAQKTAMTAVNGMVVYDTDLDKFQGYEAGAWTNLI